MAVDLDGTLLDARGQPHPRDVCAIKAALRAGVRVSIVTGRLYSGTRAVAELLGLRGTVACADGSHLVHASDHATLLHYGVKGPNARRLRDSLARAAITTFVFAGDAIGYDDAGARFLSYLKTWSNDLRLASDVFADDLWNSPEGITGAVALGSDAQIATAVAEIERELAGIASITSFPIRRGVHTGLWALIVRAAGGTKGTAVRWIAEHERVALGDTVCVGDWINDVPMFEAAGRSFVMGQAPDEVKAKATDVLLETVEAGGGVARAIEVAFGIRVF
ncbi:MAG: HAD hydrolase family protein [Myxococcota bacterium]|nr:HAD hydrolase family protein [Myxococcota bacterium]